MKKSIEERIKSRIYEAVVIGVSSGGVEALNILLSSLSEEFALAVIIVQHQHPHSNDFLARNLHEKCRITVKQAEEKEPIEPGVVYIAPPNYHLLIEDDKTFSLSVAKRVNYARPSIDVLFETAADVYRGELIGIILTGANNDGSQGLKKIKARGGLAVVQDPKTAEVDSMPKAAIEATSVDYVLSLQEMGFLLNKLSGKQDARI
jgi:two-component system chemotaxis response regulator CheB